MFVSQWIFSCTRENYTNHMVVKKKKTVVLLNIYDYITLYIIINIIYNLMKNVNE